MIEEETTGTSDFELELHESRISYQLGWWSVSALTMGAKVEHRSASSVVPN